MIEEKEIPVRPWISRSTGKVLDPINHFFDWFYHSNYNPFYRSGTLAIGLLFVLLGSGTFLLLFYSVSSPYESVVAIQEQIWLGRWLRALHRYTTDAVLIAVIFHVLQLLAQGKTWGPRTLAWISGVLLLIALFVSAWTGYVMVWDRHGQYVALGGLELMRALPFLRDELGLAFSGKDPVPSSFFFMNLFLHIAIPLGMLLLMWVHTARLARTVWFPKREVFYGTVAGLLVLSVVWPAVLLDKADLLALQGEIRIDAFYNLWIEAVKYGWNSLVFVSSTIAVLTLISIPLWWRPRTDKEPPISEIDADACTGCTQCARDCPYEAITMQPHPDGRHLLAVVDSRLCVSCAICTASCSVYASGPPGRDSKAQLSDVRQYCEETLPSDKSDESIVVVSCWHNYGVTDFLQETAVADGQTYFYGINCCGTIHSESIEILLEHAGGLLLVGCAARNCSNRDGLDLLTGRVFERRVPFLSRKVDRNRIVLTAHSAKETEEISNKIKTLRAYLKHEGDGVAETGSTLQWIVKRTVASAVLLAGIATISQASVGSPVSSGQVRIIGKIKAEESLNCRVLSQDELDKLPAHMRRAEICEQSSSEFLLHTTIDGKKRTRSFSTRGIRGELPAIITEQISVPAGSHQLLIELYRKSGAKEEALGKIVREINVNEEEVHLVNIEGMDSH